MASFSLHQALGTGRLGNHTFLSNPCLHLTLFQLDEAGSFSLPSPAWVLTTALYPPKFHFDLGKLGEHPDPLSISETEKGPAPAWLILEMTSPSLLPLRTIKLLNSMGSFLNTDLGYHLEP